MGQVGKLSLSPRDSITPSQRTRFVKLLQGYNIAL